MAGNVDAHVRDWGLTLRGTLSDLPPAPPLSMVDDHLTVMGVCDASQPVPQVHAAGAAAREHDLLVDVNFATTVHLKDEEISDAVDSLETLTTFVCDDPGHGYGASPDAFQRTLVSSFSSISEVCLP